MSTGKSSMELRVKPLGIFAILGLLAIIGAVVYTLGNGCGKKEVTDTIAPDNGINGARVLFASSKTKKDWLDKQAELFNAQYAAKDVKVTINYGETRDAYQDIINGKEKVTLWAPSSTQWISALGNYWQKNKGKALYDVAKQDEYKIYLKTPMVFLTTKAKAPFLRQTLAVPGKSLDNLRDLSTGKIKCSWGAFKYSYADPINAGSGFTMLSMVIADYATKHPELGSTDKIVASKPFLDYLKALNTAYVYDEAAFKGSSDLVKSFVADPKRYDFIYTYESNAMKEAMKNPDFVVIYPSPTATTDMSVVALTGADWANPRDIKAAKLFMQFLSEKPAMQDGVDTMFRTATVMDTVSLNAELKKVAGQGFQETFVATELPSYEPVNETAAAWRSMMKPSPAVQALMQEKEAASTKGAAPSK